MSTKYIASNWRLPNQENSSKNDNYGLTFDGTNSSINCGIPTFLNGKSTVSVSLWVKFTDTSTASYTDLLSIGDVSYGDLFLRMRPEGSARRIEFGISNSFIRATSAHFSDIASNTWIHLMGCIDINRNDGTDTAIFLNGVQIFAQDTNATISNPVTENLFLGNEGPWNPLEGSLSEVAIWDTDQRANVATLYGSSSLGAGNPMAIKPQPVGYWPLGDNSASNPLTQPNEAVEDASVFNFNQDGFIDLGTGLGNLLGDSYTDDLTFSAWIKVPASSNPQNGIFVMDSSGPPEFALLFLSNNQVWLEAGGNNIARFTSTGIDDDKWHHLVIVYDNDDATNTKLYFDNSPATKTTILSQPSSLNFNGDNTVIGTYYDSRTSFRMTAQLSNAQVWNTALTSTEVSTLYNSGVPLLTGTQPQASNLKSWYKLDQSANWDVSSSGNWTIPDASGNGNDGTSSGMTSANLVLSDLTRAVPYDSYSFNFDSASSDYITTGFSIGAISQYSFSVWFKMASAPAAYSFIYADANSSGQGASARAGIGFYQNFFFATMGNGSSVYSDQTSYNISSAYDNNWHHITLIVNGTSQELYLDGSLVHTYTSSVSAGTAGTQNYTIGRYGDYNGHYFDGGVSNLSIFNEALTSTEVLKLYSNGMPQDLSSFSPAPVAWWTLGSNSFFNGTNYICRDLIGSNDGTSANAGVDAIVGDSPRSSANGTGTNMDIPTNLEGSTKWSENNSWSINMSESARVEDTP